MNTPSALIRDSLTFVCTIRAMPSVDLRTVAGWPSNPRDWGFHADQWAEVARQLNLRVLSEHRHASLLYDCYLTAQAPINHWLCADWDYSTNSRRFAVTDAGKLLDHPRHAGRPSKRS